MYVFLQYGIEGKVLALEKRLAELKAENKPLNATLKQTIQALCLEEVGFVWITRVSQKPPLLLEISCFACVFTSGMCHLCCLIRTCSAPSS